MVLFTLHIWFKFNKDKNTRFFVFWLAKKIEAVKPATLTPEKVELAMQMKILRNLFLLLMCSPFAISCSDHDLSTVDSLNGTYVGKFTRVSSLDNTASSDVTIHFTDNEYEGHSSISKYPAICAGNYRHDGRVVEFTNNCMWTAEFDWTLILEGTFEVRRDGDVITLQKTQGDVTDIYQLKKK